MINMQEKILQKKPDKMTKKQLDWRPFANLEELVLLDTGSTCSSIMNENILGFKLETAESTALSVLISIPSSVSAAIVLARCTPVIVGARSCAC